MQAAINYNFAQPIATPQIQASAIVRKEATTKVMLFAGILTCLLLAVII